MNKKLMTVLAMVAVLTFAFATTASADEVDSECPICDFDYSGYSGPLSEGEIDGLLLALNDEYHAWAVYDQVIADFGDVRPFTNIRRSEATHISALTELFDAYDVPVPDNPWPGNVPSFDSVTDACAAGAAAEIANVDLYDELFSSTDRDDVLTVYQSLQRASEESHLPAFQRCSDGDGGQGNGGSGRGSGDGQERGGGRRGGRP
jgi:hypothetical protein